MRFPFPSLVGLRRGLLCVLCCFFRLQSLVPFSGLDLLDLPRNTSMALFVLPQLNSDVIAISRIQSRHQLWNQMRVLCRFLNRGQARTCDFALPRAWRHIAIGEMVAIAICLSFKVLLDFLLQQTQIQLSQRVRIQPVGVVGRVIANQRDIFQIFADSAKADGSVGSQSLEQKELLKGRVRGQARHEGRSRATVGGDGSQISCLSALMLLRGDWSQMLRAMHR